MAILDFHGQRKKPEVVPQALKHIGSQTSNVGGKVPTHKTIIHSAATKKSPIHNAAVTSRTAKIGCATKSKARCRG